MVALLLRLQKFVRFQFVLAVFPLNFYQFNKANFFDVTFNGESSGENWSKLRRKQKSENCGPMKQER